MSASKLRGIYRRSYRPSVDDCERELVNNWFNLCGEVEKTGTDESGYAHVMVRRLHDFGVFRQRAIKREAVRS